MIRWLFWDINLPSSLSAGFLSKDYSLPQHLILDIALITWYAVSKASPDLVTLPQLSLKFITWYKSGQNSSQVTWFMLLDPTTATEEPLPWWLDARFQLLKEKDKWRNVLCCYDGDAIS